MKGVRKFRDTLKQELRDKKFRELFAQEDLYAKLAIQISLLRNKYGWSQKELAKKLHTSQQMISRLEDSQNISCSLNTLVKIAKAFHKRLRVEFV